MCVYLFFADRLHHSRFFSSLPPEKKYELRSFHSTTSQLQLKILPLYRMYMRIFALLYRAKKIQFSSLSHVINRFCCWRMSFRKEKKIHGIFGSSIQNWNFFLGVFLLFTFLRHSLSIFIYVLDVDVMQMANRKNLRLCHVIKKGEREKWNKILWKIH